MMFRNDEESHAHSRLILDTLQEYDDYMESISSVIDLGCGSGLDLEWWATRTVRDNPTQPLNIRCTGVDLAESLPVSRKYKNISYQQNNFENVFEVHKHKFDLLWCHNSFQYCLNPVQTLGRWKNLASDNASLVMSVPETMTLADGRAQTRQYNGQYYHYSLVSLIHILALNGWDCNQGYFLKRINDPWIHVVVYKSKHEPLDPQTTTWYDLVDRKLLPASAEECVKKHGYLIQQELTLPWIDKNLTWFGR